MKSKKQFLPFISLLVLLSFLPFFLQAIKKAQRYLSRALGKTANIVVDTGVQQGPILPVWQALSQGGEEKYPFDRILPEITALKPNYIRIDHLYDFYNVVTKEDGALVFNWKELDTVVNQILQTGATPFFSLSYMPPAIALNGEITNAPENWNDWTTVVKETIQHYSGQNNKNIKNCAYEVWNEPDLFGKWKISGKKDYRLLYKYAVLGANQTSDTNQYKIGGPSVTSPYQTWTDDFLKYVIKENLRMDFYSWHRYTADPKDFLADIDNIDTWLIKNGGYAIEKYITEWGSDSDKSSWHDSAFDAAHLVATIRQTIQRTNLAFTFEIKDGPGQTKYYGGWGLLTHEITGPVEKKPKYHALTFLNQIEGQRLSLSGEGTWVTGFAVQNDEKIQTILVNLDQENLHFETVPVSFQSLAVGDYLVRLNFLKGNEQKEFNVQVTDHTLFRNIPLEANDVVLIELIKK